MIQQFRGGCTCGSSSLDTEIYTFTSRADDQVTARNGHATSSRYSDLVIGITVNINILVSLITEIDLVIIRNEHAATMQVVPGGI